MASALSEKLVNTLLVDGAVKGCVLRGAYTLGTRGGTGARAARAALSRQSSVLRHSSQGG